MGLSRAFLVVLVAVSAAGQAFAPTGSQAFEVATIKRSQPSPQHGQVRPVGGKRYSGSALPLRSYLTVAYQVRADQIVGGPAWMDTEFYDVNAEAEKSTNIEELHIMLQNILTLRFKLRFHFEKKQMQIYSLTVDKNGPKNLKEHARPNAGDVKLDRQVDQLIHEKLTAHCASLDFLAWRLSSWFDRPLMNLTGLTGCFDFKLAFTDGLPPGIAEGQFLDGNPIDTSGPNIFEALKNQLGLNLEAKKGAADTMVIDHAERPEAE